MTGSIKPKTLSKLRSQPAALFLATGGLSRGSKAGVWESLFKALADDPDFEYVMLDATIVRARQHAAGAKGGVGIRPSGARAGG